MNDSACCIPLKSVSGSEKSRSDHNINQQRSIEMFKMKTFSVKLHLRDGRMDGRTDRLSVRLLDGV